MTVLNIPRPALDHTVLIHDEDVILSRCSTLKLFENGVGVIGIVVRVEMIEGVRLVTGRHLKGRERTEAEEGWRIVR